MISPSSHRPSRWLLALLAVSVVGCAQQYSTVKLQDPKFVPITPVGKAIAKALEKDRRDPAAAMGEYIDAIRISSIALQKNPKDDAARRDYNFAVGRVMESVGEAHLDPWTSPLRVSAPDGGEYVLTHAPDPRPQWNPALYDFTPADQFDVEGSYVRQRYVKDGLGAPVVAVGKSNRADFRADFALPRIYYGVTAVARMDGRRCVLAFEDPLATETVRSAGHTFPLAADFTVPIAVMLARENPKKLELSRLLHPQKYAGTARIARLQPYDPEKTVVLFIHGLKDSPATWTEMINMLRSDPDIRKRYQFWFYSYPSGYPYPHSAAILRHELDGVEKRFPLRHKMVVVGHSMGGCISRLLLTDTDNDKLWIKIFGTPPEKMPLDPESKEIFANALIFRHRDEIGRVIFISAPLRGSDLASGWIGRIGSRLVKAPVTLLKAGNEARKIITFQSTDLRLKRIPNSVDTLSPNNRFVRTIQEFPVAPGIPYHVISGDRGKGGNKDHTKPVMSDGIVPYWSSHMDGAQSELVVPSNHSAQRNPQAIAEVRRILRLHGADGR